MERRYLRGADGFYYETDWKLGPKFTVVYLEGYCGIVLQCCECHKFENAKQRKDIFDGWKYRCDDCAYNPMVRLRKKKNLPTKSKTWPGNKVKERKHRVRQPKKV